MLPRNILIIRHGESEGNVDPMKYATIPDYQMPLTSEGIKQAVSAADYLNNCCHVLNGSVGVYYSPWERATRTANIITHRLANCDKEILFYREDPRLQEQNYAGKFGDFDHDRREEIESDRAAYGKFWYRLTGGENFSDVYNRVANFWTDKKLGWLCTPESQVDTLIIVCHGATARVFTGYLTGQTTDEIAKSRNPANCEIIALSFNAQKDLYTRFAIENLYQKGE